MLKPGALPVLFALLLCGCTSLEPVDLGRFEFAPPEQIRLRSFPVAVVNRVQQVEHRGGADPAAAAAAEYRWGDLADRYVLAVAESVAAEPDEAARTAAGATAELGLEFLGFEQRRVDGSGGHAVMDRVSAVWRLGYRDRVFAEIRVSGEGRGPRAEPGESDGQASERAGRALQNLLVNTADALSRDAGLRRFARIPGVYLEPERALEHARAALARDGSPEMLAALRYRAVERGHADVYRLVAERARVDESNLLHVAICSRHHDPDIYQRVLARSSNPNQFDAARAGTLQAALRCGREALVQGLVDAGAYPAIDVEGEPYVSAELNYRLTELLRPGGKPLQRAAGYASERYEQAIAAARDAIEQRRARAFAEGLGSRGKAEMAIPAVSAAAGLAARSGAMQAGFVDYGGLVYVNPEIDVVTEDGAVRYLEDRIRHCRARLQRLRQLY